MKFLSTTFLSQSGASQSGNTCLPRRNRSAATLMALLMATGGLMLTGQRAIAQITGNLHYSTTNGSVQIDNNAFDLQTGSLENESYIPLPAILPAETQERVAQPVVPEEWAPNTIELTTDVDYINQSLIDALGNSDEASRFTVETEKLNLTTQFNVSQQRGAHAFGEGIEATVFNAQGEAVAPSASTFVRGSKVRVGPDGQPLPEASQLNVSYGLGDTVELRVLNLRGNGEMPNESGIYFSQDGEFIVEDFQDGGDLDFNDGQYSQVSQGQGEAITIEERSSIALETEVNETPLAPEVRTEEVVETDVVEIVEQSDAIAIQEREWGRVETPDTVPTRVIGHATGVLTANDEQLVYNRYSGERQFRVGSDGIGATGQLKPLVNNPNVPPTLLTGNLTFNPFVGDNEAGLTGTLGATQFFNPTHRLATDASGNVINNPNSDGPALVEPTGLFNNRRLVGYVPPTPDKTVLGSQLLSTNGVFELPVDRSVVISPANPQTVGRGDSAYTDNVGGLLIEGVAGDMRFIPQWTIDGYATEEVSLAAGEALRVIYALVPQQAGQNLALSQTYEVTDGANGYEIAEGGFSIISADRQPQNFVEEISEVYAVEDTVPNNNNAVTDLFNGIQGVYAREIGGIPVPTVDVNSPDEADARVGNALFPLDTIKGDPGQRAYGRTTVAAGFYLNGSVTGGIGNQRDTVSSTSIAMDRVTNELRTQRTLNRFETSLVQVDTAVIQRTETTQTRGRASFDINSQGELTNVNFTSGESETVAVTNSVLERNRSIVRGEEVLVNSETSETTEVIDSGLIAMDRETNDNSDSYANFSSVQGELTLGGVLNFGNTPWTEAANTVRAELFARDTVIGYGDDSEIGWRTEVLFHPFGEVQRNAHQYDTEGNAIALYQTRPVMHANGQPLVETVAIANSKSMEEIPADVVVHEFVLDESGNRIEQTVGTGQAKGPGIYARVEDAFNDNEGLTVTGGLQFSF